MGNWSKGSHKMKDPAKTFGFKKEEKKGAAHHMMLDRSEATQATQPSYVSLDDSSRHANQGEIDFEEGITSGHFESGVVDVDEIIALRYPKEEYQGAKDSINSSRKLAIQRAESTGLSNNNLPLLDLWRNAETDAVVDGNTTAGDILLGCGAVLRNDSAMLRSKGIRLNHSPTDTRHQTKRIGGGTPTSLLSHNRMPSLDRQLSTMSEFGHLSRQEYRLIQEILLRSCDLRPMALHSLAVAFEKAEVERGDIIIRQGDSCENGYVYIVVEGECVVHVDGIPVPGPYGTYKPKSIFGELGVLYNATRAATVSAKTDRVVLYRACGSAFTKAFHFQPDDEDIGETQNEDFLREIDAAIDQVSGTKSLYGGDIIRQYQPGRLWLWSQWSGTILEHNIKTAMAAMLLSAIFTLMARLVIVPTWSIGGIPDENHPVIQHLSQLRKCWQLMMPLVTFVLTFYVNQAYILWQKTTVTMRQIQGRISDFSLLLATSCKRNADGTYTDAAVSLMDDVGASSRIFHALYWSKYARRFHCLSTSTGLARMAQRGMITPKQLQVLQSLNTPSNTYFNACLEWMMIRAHQGIEADLVYNPGSVSLQLLGVMCQLRGATARVTDMLKSRMPLAYTHFVQVLVDTFVWSAPFVLYADLGMYSVLCVGIIALFYTGLMDLAKLFLDPLNNQCCSSTAISMGMDLGVLTRESNNSSNHYKESGASIPF